MLGFFFTFYTMDINKIFGLFDSSSRNDLGINALNQDDLKARIKFFDEFRNHPVVWIGMFHKLIMDNAVSKTLLTTFKTTFPDLDVNDIRNAGEYIIYTKAYEFIRNLNIKRDLDLQVLINHSNINVLTSVRMAISYFEETEAYEKCAFLLPIKKIIEENVT
jgi:hypothetical protein